MSRKGGSLHKLAMAMKRQDRARRFFAFTVHDETGGGSQRQLDPIGMIPIPGVFRENEEIVRDVPWHCGGYAPFIG